ncbi:MAG: hypothetical protein AAGK05_07940 [Pseudomonadota bacterium]
MEQSNHEEADTRIILHIIDAVKHGARHLLVRTVDTDVIVILVGKMKTIRSIHPAAQIFVAFGNGRNFQFIDVNRIYKEMGEVFSECLPVFHAFTGCDTTSSFYGKGKKSA